MNNTRRTLAMAALAAAIGSPATLPQAKPETAGMSADRLQRIGTWLTGIVQRKEAAGFVALVARRGKVVYHQAHGTRGLTVNEPMPLDALFDLASMTKPVTVTAALTLLEEGRFSLHEPVSKYLPEFRTPMLEAELRGATPARRPVLVEHVFTHTSGVHTELSRAQIFDLGTLENFVKSMAAPPLRYQPGSTWLYGNSHDVLGLLIERVSGKRLDQYVQERILTPLAMNDTHYWPPEQTNKRRAVLVVDGKDDLASTSRVSPQAAKAKTFFGGGSGLYSTAADYWRFAQMLLNGGTLDGRRILGPRTVSWLAQDHIKGVHGFTTPGTRFGLGFAVVTDPGSSGLPYSEGTYYWSGSQGTVFWIDPKEDLIGVLMVQLTPSTLNLRAKFSALVYSSIID